MNGPIKCEVGSGSCQSIIEETIQLALRGLPQMYYFDRGSFCYRTELRGSELIKIGISRTNTLIALLGIRKAEIAGHQPPIEVVPAMKTLRATASQFDRIGDVGLNLWLSSMFPAETSPLDWSIFGFEKIFRQGYSTGLGDDVDVLPYQPHLRFYIWYQTHGTQRKGSAKRL